MVFTPLNQVLFACLLKDDVKPEQSETKKKHSESLMVDDRDKLVEHKPSKGSNIIRRLDEFVLKPLFIWNYEERAVLLAFDNRPRLRGRNNQM